MRTSIFGNVILMALAAGACSEPEQDLGTVAQEATASTQGIGVPAYFGETDNNSYVLLRNENVEGDTSLVTFAIVNAGCDYTGLHKPPPNQNSCVIAGGPGSSTSTELSNRIRELHEGHVGVFGYVYMGPVPVENSGPPYRSTNDVLQDIERWRTYPQVDGIFFDRAHRPSTAGLPKQQYLQEYVSPRFGYAQFFGASVPGRSMFNWGDTPSHMESYVNCIVTRGAGWNYFVLHETAESTFLGRTAPAWIANFNPYHFSSMIHGAHQSMLSSVVAKSRELNTGNIYITDRTLEPNPWETLPSFNLWSAQLQAVNQYPVNYPNGSNSDVTTGSCPASSPNE